LSDVIFLIIGAFSGGMVAWFLARARTERGFNERLRSAEGNASAAGALLDELREQAQRKEEELSRMGAALREEQNIRVKAETRFEEAERALGEQREMLEAMKGNLTESFRAMSLEALSKNSGEFLKLAEETLKARTVEGGKELEGKKELIDRNIKAMTEKLAEMQRKVEEVGQGSLQRMLEVSGQIKGQAEATLRLSETTEHLRRTLASSKKRGEWGERMAEDVIRLVGMVEGINYIKQKSLEHAPGIPDYTFLLPGNLKINMDVKFPLENYRHYLEAHTDADRKRYRDELLKNARVMIKEVTTREYINPTENTVDYVLVFIPNEQVYGFLNESDVTLMDESLRLKVILCSPFTLYAVLAVIRQAVENFNLEQTASEILKLLGEFSKQWKMYKEKFKTMGDRLEAARREYDTLVTTRSNQLEKPLKKIEELRKQKAIEFEESIDLDEQPSP
jgi:DNA recombination protein RmuC